MNRLEKRAKMKKTSKDTFQIPSIRLRVKKMLKITNFVVVVQLPSFANPDLSSILNSSNSISPDPSLSISRINPTMSIVIYDYKPNITD